MDGHGGAPTHDVYRKADFLCMSPIMCIETWSSLQVAETVQQLREARVNLARVVPQPVIQEASAKATTSKQLGEALGARFLLRGNVARADKSYTVDLAVVDAESGRVLASKALVSEGGVNPIVSRYQIDGALANLTYKAMQAEVERARAKPYPLLDVRDLTWYGSERERWIDISSSIPRRPTCCICGASPLSSSGGSKKRFWSPMMPCGEILTTRARWFSRRTRSSKLHRLPDALAASETAVEVADNVPANIAAAEVLYAMRNDSSAIVRARKAVSLMSSRDREDPGNGVAVLLIAAAQARSGNLDRAKQTLAEFRSDVRDVRSIRQMKLWLGDALHLDGEDLFDGLRIAGVSD
jgi:hypothetical protein